MFFFFQGSRHHRDLHSFPTRRSSDLQHRARAGDAVEPTLRVGQRAEAQFVPAAQPYPRFANQGERGLDRKSTRLNSSHVSISYAVFCLKKKKKRNTIAPHNSTKTHTI